MSTDYPTGVDSFPPQSDTTPNKNNAHAGFHTDLADAIVALEETLGLNPQGEADTVAERLDAITAQEGPPGPAITGFHDVDTDYTLALVDAGKIVCAEAAVFLEEEEVIVDDGERIVTIPTDAEVDFPVGARIGVAITEVPGGTAANFLVPVEGVGLLLSGEQQLASLRNEGNWNNRVFIVKIAPNTWAVEEGVVYREGWEAVL